MQVMLGEKAIEEQPRQHRTNLRIPDADCDDRKSHIRRDCEMGESSARTLHRLEPSIMRKGEEKNRIPEDV